MSHKQLWKWIKRLGLVSVFLFIFVPTAIAFEGRSEQTVVINADEVIEDDLYIAADRVVMNGVVHGDVFAVGTTIEINGTVEGDVVGAGQQIIINGTVTDDVRFAGSAVTLGEGALIKSDLLAAGFGLEMRPGAMVESDLLFAGAQALVAGDIGRDAMLYVNGLDLRGEIGRNLTAEVGAAGQEAVPPTVFMPNGPAMPVVPAGLQISEGSHVGGNFEYTTPATIAIPAGLVTGKVTEHIVTVETTVTPPVIAFVSANWYLEQLRRLVTLFLLGALLIWLVPKSVEHTADTVAEKPWSSLGWGFFTLVGLVVAFVLVVVVMVALAIFFGSVTLSSLVGLVILLGLLTLFVLIAAAILTIAYGAAIAVSYLVGRYILTYFNPTWREKRVVALLVGLFLFVVLTAVPYLGGWINFAVILFGLGALWLLGRSLLATRRTGTALMKQPQATIHPTGA